MEEVVPGLLDLAGLPDSLSPDEFWSCFGKVEHERLDFKVRVADSLQETIAAMAMTDGGVIVLGVRDDRTLLGCAESPATIDAVGQAAAACADPVPVRRRGIDVAAVPLTIVHVPANRIVTTSSGRLLRRSGSSNLPLRGEEAPGSSSAVSQRT